MQGSLAVDRFEYCVEIHVVTELMRQRLMNRRICGCRLGEPLVQSCEVSLEELMDPLTLGRGDGQPGRVALAIGPETAFRAVAR